MKMSLSTRATLRFLTLIVTVCVMAGDQLNAAVAPLLFADEFNTIDGWTAVKPVYNNYQGTTMAWGYDQVTDSLFENSNIFTDASSSSSSRIAVMLINDTVPPTAGYEYKTRLTMVDNDGAGLIFGYQNEQNFYRLSFAFDTAAGRSTGWPFIGWNFDRMVNNSPVDLAGQSLGTIPNYVPVANVPFDITISVTNDHVWIRLIDNPDVTPTSYDLVIDQVLPSTPSGKVGLFSWGMSSTAQVPGFAAQRRSLSPTPLSGISTNTTGWQNLITPNATGTTWGSVPIWARFNDGNGNGVLREKSDLGVENDSTHRVDFRTSAYVAGDTNWTDYVMHSRVQLYDDDGWGIYVRYIDSTNFTRVAFRVQSGSVTTGVKVGTSVQKCTNMVFSEVFLNAGGANAPAANGAGPTATPGPTWDMFAVVQTNSLLLHFVSTLDGSSSTFTKGPVAMNNFPNGKVGIWGWYQNYNDWDFVRVYAMTNTPLYIQSAYGPVTPPAGMNDLPLGGTVNAYAPDAIDAPGQKRVATGWRRTFENGNVLSGSTTNVTFTLNQMSTLRWDWKLQYQLTVSTTPGGTVNFIGSQYLDNGTVTNLVATPSAGYIFVGWSGLPSASLSTNLTLTMVRPHTVTAKFAPDSDGDGLADDWEMTYFGNLGQTANGDPDGDGRNNLAEFWAGTNPNYSEPLVATDGMSARWINEGRDRAIPGWFVVTNFGPGFRGLYENSNQGLAANAPGVSGVGFIDSVNYVVNTSFQSPLFVVRTNYWNNDWLTNFSLQVEYTVGDNDGSCIYINYQNEYNWYRITYDGQATGGSLVNPIQGISLQRRTNGYFSSITPTFDGGSQPGLFPDPTDFAGFTKRLKITVGGTNGTFEVRAIGWNTNLNGGLGDWDPAFERITTFTDTAIPNGRIGFSSWAQGSFGFPTATNGNPVYSGWFADNITVTNNGALVFSEDWESVPLSTELPAGWSNPYTNTLGLVGDWRVTAHQTLGQLSSSFSTLQSGPTNAPKTDAEGPLLVAPALTNANFALEIGITPYDDGGMGFVYDYVDTNNFSRVLFDSQIPTAGQLAQGLNISRKSAGVWTDVVVGDNSFIYTPGRAFDLRFSSVNGVYSLVAWNLDDPSTVYRWQWTNAPVASPKYGLAVWNMPDAHYRYVRAYNINAAAPTIPFKITNITLSGGNVILDISKPVAASYHVLRATDVAGPYATNAANQTGNQYIEAQPSGSLTYYYRLQLLP